MTNLADYALRSRFPRPVKEFVRTGVESFGEATNRFRSLPDYIIIGGQRCGTTSLYQYLIDHPAIGPASTKEVHFFDVNYARGIGWYRGHFPTLAYLHAVASLTGLPAITGEASPYYLFHPRAPYRVAETLPDVKLVVMLRDPVSRLISHYHHEVSLGHESLPLEEALAREQERLSGEEERILDDPVYRGLSHQNHSYFARGLYADQLATWLRLFPREQVKIIETRRFFKEPTVALDGVLRYLGLPDQGRVSFEAHNALTYPSVDPATRARLYEAYAPHNDQLYALVGEDFGWTTKPGSGT